MRAKSIAFILALLTGLPVVGSSTASAQGVQLFAILNGGNEVSATGQAAAGDPDGHGAASVIFITNRQICFSIAVDNIDRPTAAHIHENVAGRNGPIVVDLSRPLPATGNPGTWAGCVSGINAALLRRIGSTPSQFYINVHTRAFPAGAVRGQLF